MSSNIIIGIDASYTRTGISIIDLKNKTLRFLTASEKIGDKKFDNIYKAAKSVVSQIVRITSEYSNDFSIVIEEPLPRSSMSPALYALDVLILSALYDHVVKTYNVSTLTSRIHGHKYTKTDSQDLAIKYINELSKKGYRVISTIGTKRKITHDNSEAFLYAHLYLHDNNHADFQFDNSGDIKKYKERMKNLKKKEKELLANTTDISIT